MMYIDTEDPRTRAHLKEIYAQLEKMEKRVDELEKAYRAVKSKNLLRA